MHPISLKRLNLPFNLSWSQTVVWFQWILFCSRTDLRLFLQGSFWMTRSPDPSLVPIGSESSRFLFSSTAATQAFTSLFRGHRLMKKVDHVSEVCKPSFWDTFTYKGIFGRWSIFKGIWSLDLLPKAPDHGAQIPQIRGLAHGIYDAPVCYQTGWHASTTPR